MACSKWSRLERATGKLELRAKRGGSSVELREMGESGGVCPISNHLHESDDESRLLLECERLSGDICGISVGAALEGELAEKGLIAGSSEEFLRPRGRFFEAAKSLSVYSFARDFWTLEKTLDRTQRARDSRFAAARSPCAVSARPSKLLARGGLPECSKTGLRSAAA